MRARHCLIATVAASVILVLAIEEPSHAQIGPAEWTLLGQVALDSNGCAMCPATFATPSRFLNFGLSSDSPFAINLSGRIDVVCSDGVTYNELLVSPQRGGLFQLVRNSCVNFESEKLMLSMTTVGLSPPDKDRGVMVSVYGIGR